MSIFKSKNLMLYIIISVVAVFTVSYFIVVNKVSYAFETNENVLYDSKISMIEIAAKTYAEYTEDFFGEEDFVYLTVGDLVEKGAILPDNDEGEVLDPNSENKSLNDLKIKITKKNNKIVVSVLN